MKKLFFILAILVVVFTVSTQIYALDPNNINTNVGTIDDSTKLKIQNVWQTVVVVVQILAVAAVVFAGLRYMFASADQRADIKKSLSILVIGAILVFGAVSILQLISGASSAIIKP